MCAHYIKTYPDYKKYDFSNIPHEGKLCVFASLREIIISRKGAKAKMHRN